MRLTGVAAAPGFASGPIWRHRDHASAPARSDGTARDSGAARADGATLAADPVDPDRIAATAAAQLQAIADQLRAARRPEEALIFEAQGLLAEDPTLLDDWRDRLAAGEEPVAALDAATAAAAELLASLDDELLAARAADVRDVGARMRRILTGEGLELPTEPSIVIAEDLPPSTAAEIPSGLLLGIALQAGSRTAHAAILARSLGIPCVVSVAGLLATVDALPLGSAVDVDGATGVVLTEPTAAEREAMRSAQADALRREEQSRAFRDRPAQTLDGHRVTLVANIGKPADVPRALELGAEGVGLFRTEFLFMSRQTPPTEAEQFEAYRAVFAGFGPDRPVVVRLADIGGDKDIPYLHLPHEANPFLGVRAIRLAHADRALYLTQIRAISRAAAAAGVVPQIMAAMVTTVADVTLLHDLIREAQASLTADGLPAAPHIVTGIMVEVPSAAFLAQELAPLVDFFSIGTNDLTQYLLAADRTSGALAGMQDALHPAVLRAIRLVTAGAAAAGKPVAVCGELAGDPAGALVLLGLGVTELSADAGSLDALRYHVAAVTWDQVLGLGASALAATTAAEVRAMAAELLALQPPPPEPAVGGNARG